MNIVSNIKENITVKIQKNLNKEYIRRMLNIIGSTPVLFAYGGTFSSQSDKYLNMASIKILKQAYSEKATVAYGSLFVPFEFFHALDLTPFMPEVMAGFTASLKLTDKTLKEASARWYTPDSCTFHRSASGAVELGLFPEPKFSICTNLACDSAQKTFYLDAKKFNLEKNFYLIDVPYEYSRESLAYLASQFKEISMDICKKLGKKLDIDKFKKILNYSNEFRKWALLVNEIRKELIEYPPNYNGLNFILPFHGLAGKRDGVTLYKKIYHELKQYLKKQNNDISFDIKKYKKILWMHLKPYYKNNIFTILDQNNFKVVFEEINYVYWPELDPEDPFISLAKKMLLHPLNGKIGNRLNAILNIANDYNIDGAILFSHWGCKQSNGGARIISDRLKSIGVPTLILDGDCVNKNNSSEGQITTRLQGFIEILNSR